MKKINVRIPIYIEDTSNKIEIFIKRLKKLNIELEIVSNFP
jgi:hypothetical protein